MRTGGVILTLVLAMGCGGGGGGVILPPAGLQALSQELIDCLRDRNLNLFRLLAAAAQLFDAAANPANPPPDVTRFEATANNPDFFDFDLQLDLDGDGLNDAVATGQFRISDGSFEPFSGFEIDWALANGDALTGGGSFSIVFLGDNRFELTGNGEIRTADGTCGADLTFLPAAPFAFTLPLDRNLRRVAAEVEGATFTGSARALVTYMDDVADALLGFAAGTQTVTGTDITLNGEEGIQPFVYAFPDVPPVVIDVQALLDCTTGQLTNFGTLLERAIEIAGLLQSGGQPPAGTTFEPSMSRDDPPFTWDFETDLGNGVSATGKIRFSADPEDGVLPGDSATLTATFNTRDGEIGNADLEVEFGLITHAIAGTVFFMSDVCTTTLTTARDGALGAVGTDLQGSMNATVRSRPGVGLDLTVTFPAGQGAVLTGQTTNGDPVPRTTIDRFP